MASTPVVSFRPAVLQTGAFSLDRRISGKKAASGGGSWWTPIFGWPAEPDYVERAAAGDTPEADGASPAEKGGKRRTVAFTDEKARRLRMMTAETSTFHDVMYHSSIAARLASDFTGKSEH